MSATARKKLLTLLRDDPRSAILLHEILGPPPGLRSNDVDP